MSTTSTGAAVSFQKVFPSCNLEVPLAATQPSVVAHAQKAGLNAAAYGCPVFVRSLVTSTKVFASILKKKKSCVKTMQEQFEVHSVTFWISLVYICKHTC